MTAIDKTCDVVHYVAPELPLAFSLQLEDVIDRSETDIPSDTGAFATSCILIAPAPLVISFNGMFARGWQPNAGRPDAYYRYIDDTWLGISLDGCFWRIERVYPGRPAAVLAVGCGLVVTRSPMAAAQLAEFCNPEPPESSPLKWGPY